MGEADVDVVIELKDQTSTKVTTEVPKKINELQDQIQSYNKTISSFAQTMTTLTKLGKNQHPSFVSLRGTTVDLAVRYAVDGGALHKAINVVGVQKTFTSRYLTYTNSEFKPRLVPMASAAKKHRQQLEEVAQQLYQVVLESKDLAKQTDDICNTIETAARSHDQDASLHEEERVKHTNKADKSTRVRRRSGKGVLIGALAVLAAPVLAPVAVGGAIVASTSAAVAGIETIKKRFHKKRADKAKESAAIAAGHRAYERNGLELTQKLRTSTTSFSTAMETISKYYTGLASRVSQVHQELVDAQRQSDESELEKHYSAIRGAATEIVQQCNMLSAMATRTWICCSFLQP